MVFSLFKKNKGEEQIQPGHTKYYDLTVKDVIKRTSEAISIVFEQPEEPIKYQAGQFLTLVMEINGEEVRRAYSLDSSPYVDSDLSVTVKRVEGGLMSNYLNDKVKAGDVIKIMEPMGHFTTEFDAENKRHIIMFAGGSGITPMMSIIKSLLQKEPESIVSLIYCNRNIESIIFEDVLEKIQNSFEGRFHMIHILDSAPMNWQGPSGFLNKEMLTKLFERIPDWGIDNTTYLMCGPEGMMNNAQTLLEELHIPSDKIFRESFVTSTMKKQDQADNDIEVTAQEVTVIYDGEEHTFTVEPNNTILETALDNDIDLPFSCQSGLCTACRCKLISGKVKMDEEEGLSEAEKEEGYVLICVGHPVTADVKLQVG